MDITNTTAQSPTQPLTGTTDTQAAAVLSSDFETFLQMLTAQARFQDPLEPIDSSEYAAQLAQFSMVEQQVQSNELLKALSAQLGQGNIGQMASWIGMEARTTAPVRFDGQAITVYTQVTPGAEEASLIAYNSDGTEVQRQSIPTSATEFQWVGRTETGTELPSGSYSFAVESRTAGQSVGTIRSETFSRINEVQNTSGATSFVLNSGANVTAEDVRALREAS